MKHLLRTRKGQGTTEYIVILAIAMGIAMTVFWGPIKSKLTQRVAAIGDSIDKAK